jgi:imidazole glycerol-phosphate synthase subunit HisH
VIDIIDYGGGNTGSVMRAFTRLDVPFRLVSRDSELRSAGAVVLPGVGAFGAVMNGLRSRGLDKALISVIDCGRPFLGICVGLQVLFEASEESPGVAGLGILKGNVERFGHGKVPQVGWNAVTPRRGNGFREGFAYFVNSYVARPACDEDMLYTSDYHGPFCAGVLRDNVLAFQFHPERSARFGHELLRRWVDAL